MRINANEHETVAPELEQVLKERINNAPFPKFLGMELEEVRKDYARMRVTYRDEMNQPAGIVHGGVTMSLIDTVVVSAILSNVPGIPDRLVTIDAHTHFLAPVIQMDMVAEAVVRKRGRKIVFLFVEVRTPDGTLVADGTVAYKVVYENVK